MHDQKGKLLVQARRSPNRLYKVRMGINDVDCLKVTTVTESHKWHASLGHVNTDTMKLIISKELVRGIPNVDIEKKICKSCLLGKQPWQTFPQPTSYRAEQVLQLIHGDLCGPITPSTLAGNKYIFVLIDDHSRYMWTILLK